MTGFLASRGVFERRDHPGSPSGMLLNWIGGRRTASGARVDQRSVLSSSAVYSAVQTHATTLASVPLKVFAPRTSVEGGSDVATEHATYSVVHDEPNPEQTSMEFRELVHSFMLLRGTGYAEIVRDGGGFIRELWPIPTYRATPLRPYPGGPLYYSVTPPASVLSVGTQQTTAIIPAENMLKIRGFSENGVLGLDVVDRLAEVFGLTLALQEASSRYFGNGSLPGGYLKHPKSVKPETKKKIREQFEDSQRGLENMHRIALLEEGVEFVQLTTDPEKSQLLGSKQFAVRDVARIFNLPPHMLGDLADATFSNVEQMAIQFVTISLRPHAVRWEQALRRDLLLPSEKARGLYFRHGLEGLLRGDIKTRFDALHLALQDGVLNADEWRAFEDWNPQPDGQGQVYYRPLNMVPKSQDAAGAPPIDDEEDDPAADPANRARAGASTRRAAERRDREAAAAELRRRHQRAHRTLFAAAAQRVIGREANAVRAALKRSNSGADGAHLRSQIDEYYAGHADNWVREMEPVMRALAEVVEMDAAHEVSQSPSGVTPDLEVHVHRMAESLGRRMVRSSRAQLAALLRASGDDPSTAIAARLLDWEGKRSHRVGRDETVRLGSAVAEFSFQRQGVVSLGWVLGRDCTICTNLAGRTVRMGQAFLATGDTLDVPGADPFVARSTFRHPPLHDGCDCAIVAR